MIRVCLAGLISAVFCVPVAGATVPAAGAKAPPPVTFSHPLLAAVVQESLGLPTESLLLDGVDPHHFEPKPSHIKALRAAPFVVILQRNDEAWILKSKGPKTSIVDLSDLQLSHHPWLDPDELPRFLNQLNDRLPEAQFGAKTSRDLRLKDWSEKWSNWFKAQKNLSSSTPSFRSIFVKDLSLVNFGKAVGVPLQALSQRSHAEEFTLPELKAAKAQIQAAPSPCYLMSQGETSRIAKALSLPLCSQDAVQMDRSSLWDLLQTNADLLRFARGSSQEVSK